MIDDRGLLDCFPSQRIVAGQRIWVTGHNRPVRRRLDPLLAGADRPATGPIDLALVAPETCEEWGYFAAKILPRLVRSGEVGLVLAAEEAEMREAIHPLPRAYHDAAGTLGLSRNGVWVASSVLLLFRFAPATNPDSAKS